MISFRNASLSFGEKKVLDNFSLDIEASGATCFSGPSGSGKTTLFRVIAGLIPLQGGDFSSPYKKPALMFQEDRLLPWLTALQNVSAVLPEGDTASALRWLDEVGLKNERGAYPSELSGGMRRRLALARALAYGGDLLLLDEPFKGLDKALVLQMASIITSQSAPSLIVTHSADEIELLGGRAVYFEGPPLRVISEFPHRAP